jgi:hypothetical protein
MILVAGPVPGKLALAGSARHETSAITAKPKNRKTRAAGSAPRAGAKSTPTEAATAPAEADGRTIELLFDKNPRRPGTGRAAPVDVLLASGGQTVAAWSSPTATRIRSVERDGWIGSSSRERAPMYLPRRGEAKVATFPARSSN